MANEVVHTPATLDQPRVNGGAKVTAGPVVIDLGRKNRRQVKKLRKGRGKLLDRIDQLMTELKMNASVPEGGQPVIVVVRERPGTRKFKFF